MFNANPEATQPAADTPKAGGDVGQPPIPPQAYPTPPQLDTTISPEQRAAISGPVLTNTEASSHKRGLIAGVVFGAIVGGIFALVTHSHKLLKTAIGAAVGGGGGYFLSNNTWRSKPDVELPTSPSEAPVQIPPVTATHTEQLQARRAASADSQNLVIR